MFSCFTHKTYVLNILSSKHSHFFKMSKQDDFAWRKSHSEAPSPQYNSPRANYPAQKTRSYHNSPYTKSRTYSQSRKPGYPNYNRDSRAPYDAQDYGSLPYDEQESYHKSSNYSGHSGSQSNHGNYHNSPKRGPPRLTIPKNTWLFSTEEIKANCPSVLEGMTLQEITFSISKGVNFILQVAAYLKLPQMVIYAAATFLHRFYLRYSLKKFHHYVSVSTVYFS